MGWKCNTCSTRGPEQHIRWCPECGSTSWEPTDDCGLTLDDRTEQTEMLREAMADERAARIFGYVVLFTSAVMAVTVALLFFEDSIRCDTVAIAVFLACLFLASLFDDGDTAIVDHPIYPWEEILDAARLRRDLDASRPAPAALPAPRRQR